MSTQSTLVIPDTCRWQYGDRPQDAIEEVATSVMIYERRAAGRTVCVAPIHPVTGRTTLEAAHAGEDRNDYDVSGGDDAPAMGLVEYEISHGRHLIAAEDEVDNDTHPDEKREERRKMRAQVVLDVAPNPEAFPGAPPGFSVSVDVMPSELDGGHGIRGAGAAASAIREGSALFTVPGLVDVHPMYHRKFRLDVWVQSNVRGPRGYCFGPDVTFRALEISYADDGVPVPELPSDLADTLVVRRTAGSQDQSSSDSGSRSGSDSKREPDVPVAQQGLGEVDMTDQTEQGERGSEAAERVRTPWATLIKAEVVHIYVPGCCCTDVIDCTFCKGAIEPYRQIAPRLDAGYELDIERYRGGNNERDVSRLPGPAVPLYDFASYDELLQQGTNLTDVGRQVVRRTVDVDESGEPPVYLRPMSEIDVMMEQVRSVVGPANFPAERLDNAVRRTTAAYERAAVEEFLSAGPQAAQVRAWELHSALQREVGWLHMEPWRLSSTTSFGTELTRMGRINRAMLHLGRQAAPLMAPILQWANLQLERLEREHFILDGTAVTAQSAWTIVTTRTDATRILGELEIMVPQLEWMVPFGRLIESGEIAQRWNQMETAMNSEIDTWDLQVMDNVTLRLSVILFDIRRKMYRVKKAYDVSVRFMHECSEPHQYQDLMEALQWSNYMEDRLQRGFESMMRTIDSLHTMNDFTHYGAFRWVNDWSDYRELAGTGFSERLNDLLGDGAITDLEFLFMADVIEIFLDMERRVQERNLGPGSEPDRDLNELRDSCVAFRTSIELRLTALQMNRTADTTVPNTQSR